jgi:hypothetical protein
MIPKVVSEGNRLTFRMLVAAMVLLGIVADRCFAFGAVRGNNLVAAISFSFLALDVVAAAVILLVVKNESQIRIVLAMIGCSTLVVGS